MKLLFLGPNGVGRHSLLHCINNNKNLTSNDELLELDGLNYGLCFPKTINQKSYVFCLYTIDYDEDFEKNLVKLINDDPSEEFSSVILCYDLSNINESITNIKNNFVNILKKYNLINNKDKNLILLGCKKDLKQNNEEINEEFNNLLQEYNGISLEFSSLDKCDNYDQLLLKLSGENKQIDNDKQESSCVIS